MNINQVEEEEKTRFLDILDDLADDSGYKACFNNGIDQAFHRHQPKSPIHDLKFRTRFEVPTDQVISVVSEADLIPTWNKYAACSGTHESQNTFDMSIYCQLWLPWPAQNRNLLVNLKIVDLLDSSGTHAVFISPVDLDVHKQVFQNKGGIRLKILHSAATVTPIFDPVTKQVTACDLALLLTIDPEMYVVPDWLISYVLEIMVPWMFARIRVLMCEIRDDTNNPFHIRIKKNPNFYDELRKQIVEYGNKNDKDRIQTFTSFFLPTW
eukprot:c17330_g1_i2.p1 GENE.c17330_g1_i2~~c17330_g1_i2.p1  ORF type:complete len:267 (+),score=95.43 c17330_g1_i2:3-803(+)